MKIGRRKKIKVGTGTKLILVGICMSWTSTWGLITDTGDVRGRPEFQAEPKVPTQEKEPLWERMKGTVNSLLGRTPQPKKTDPARRERAISQGPSLAPSDLVPKQLDKKPLLEVIEAGRPGDAKLSRSPSGVPSFPVPVAQDKKVRLRLVQVPLLDVGLESKISRGDFKLPVLSIPLLASETAVELSSPPVMQDETLHVLLHRPVEVPMDPNKAGSLPASREKPLTAEDIMRASPKYKQEIYTELKVYKPLSDSQLKMLSALIFLNRGTRCASVIGLFHELTKEPNLEREAKFHLGSCASKMGIHQVAFEYLSEFIKVEDREWAPKAIQILAGSLQPDFEIPFRKLFVGIKDKSWIPKAAESSVYYRVAKGAFKLKEYGEARRFADLVAENSDEYLSAQFLSSLSIFAVGQKKVALARLQGLQGLILEGKKSVDKGLASLVALTIARLEYGQGQHQAAYKQYQRVDKDHPLWVTALIEQGWAQIGLGDHAGAIGNMYSLHSPYFKTVYKPASFVVRTIGYLNICQYGDAYRTLSLLEDDYRIWSKKLEEYLKSPKTPQNHFELVRDYLRGKSDQDHAGLPHQVIREAARQRDYLNVQQALNERLQELEQFNGVHGAIRKERDSYRSRLDMSKRRLEELRAKQQVAIADPALKTKVSEYQRSIDLELAIALGHQHVLFTLEQSRRGFVEFKQQAESRIQKDIASLRLSAGRLIAGHLERIQSEMKRVLDNNEFLRYEVFAGSGENIRYQVAGGQTAGPSRIPASVKPEKPLNWSFDGEYWEDEIGNYRSNLKNNCPKEQVSAKE